jgi:predicted nucleic acid-binding protein
VISVDTNIVVRLLTADDPEQYEQARSVFEREEVFIADTVLLETEWVLRYAYDFDEAQVVGALRRLLGLPNVHLRASHPVHRALRWHAAGLDFADALHIALSHHTETFVTFDRACVRSASTLNTISVRTP